MFPPHESLHYWLRQYREERPHRDAGRDNTARMRDWFHRMKAASAARASSAESSRVTTAKPRRPSAIFSSPLEAMLVKVGRNVAFVMASRNRRISAAYAPRPRVDSARDFWSTHIVIVRITMD